MMPADKAESETPEKETAPAAVDQAPPAQRKPAGPQVGEVQRMAAEKGAPAPQRAGMMKAMQQSVGNTRAGQMMGGQPEDQAQAQTAFGKGQPKKKEPGPKKPPSITFPLPEEATRKPKGEAEFTAGKVKVVVLPDKKTDKPIIVKGKKKDAMTNVSLHWEPPTAKTRDGKVISVDPLPAPVLSIQTTYGPKAGPEMKSSYGRGTTKEDIATGKTSLGYHEGSHGTAALQYTRDHPLPVFTGAVGMAEDEFIAAQDEYNAKMEAYKQALLEYQARSVDCVGTPDLSCKED